MNKRIRKKRRKAQINKIQWAVQTIKEWMERIEKKIKENPAEFREFMEQAENVEPYLKLQMIEYSYFLEREKAAIIKAKAARG